MRSPLSDAVRLLAPALLFLVGCPATSEQVRPPQNQFYFPTGMAISPDESLLFVANANSDLRYDSGMVTPVDLDVVDEIFEGWIAGALSGEFDCEPDRAIPYTLICNERHVILPGSAVRIGNFSTDLAVQELEGGALRLFVAVRGDPSLTWIDWDPNAGKLVCGGAAPYPQCDDEHRLTSLRGDPALRRLPDEPFNVYVDSRRGFALLTHLTQGAVTLADAPVDGSPPVLADALGGLFQPHPVTGVRGAVGVAGRPRAHEDDGDFVYVTSRSESRVQVLSVARTGAFSSIVANDFFFLDRVIPSDDARGVAFSSDGSRAYVVNRNPPMLHVVDTTLGEFGTPKNQFVSGVELCQQASNVVVADVGRGDRVYVACFRDGEIWAIDPVGGVLEAIATVGRGPHALAVAPGRAKLYVTNFLEDTVSVIDLEPGSPLENRVALKLSRPRQSGGDPELMIP